MLKFIEDLGVIEYGTKGNRRRHWKMQCMCGEYLSVPANNIKSGNTTKCKLCANRVSASLAKEQAGLAFVEKATAVHGNTYDYSNTVYMDSLSKVSICCTECGEVFTQSPHSHLSGSGCPTCADTGFKPDKPAILYYFEIDGVYKIGITGRTLEQRYNYYDRSRINVINTWYFDKGSAAYEYEQNIIKLYSEFLYTGVTPFTDGTAVTECFCIDIYSISSL